MSKQWTCPKCGRRFRRERQPHSCQQVSLEDHFKNREKAKKIFDCLVDHANARVGECRIVSIPSCVHLSGNYDFLAVFPKKDGLEIRFLLGRELDSPRLTHSVKVSLKVFKNCFFLKSATEVDDEFIGWLKESYNFKDGYDS